MSQVPESEADEFERAFTEARERMPAGRQSVLNIGPMVAATLDLLDLEHVPPAISLRDWAAR
jgi:hypothetical protein